MFECTITTTFCEKTQEVLCFLKFSKNKEQLIQENGEIIYFW